jgi:hypothetical protein
VHALRSKQAALERLLQQLVAVHEEWLEANGGLGEPFRLSRHLLPPPPPSAQQPPKRAQHPPQQANGATPMERD